MSGLAATSEIREIVVCGFILFNNGDRKEPHIYFHISFRKTLVPFALSRLGFILSSFLTLALSFIQHK